MPGIFYVTVKNENASGLNLPRPGNDAQQRRFSNTIGADETNHASCWKIDRDRVEGDSGTVTLRDTVDTRNRNLPPDHCAALPCNGATHPAAGSNLI
jgi:hypothetical protein